MTENLMLKILHISRIQREKMKISTDNKKCSVLSYRLRGNSHFKYKGKNFTVTPENLIYIPKGSKYSQYTAGEDVIFVHFYTLGEAMPDFQIIDIKDRPEISELMLMLYNTWTQKQKNYSYFCISLLYRIIAETSVILVEGNKKNNIFEIKKYLELHSTSLDFKMSELYTEFGISHSLLNKLFKENFGMTPVQYVNKKRIEMAMFLLDGEDYTTAQIAEMCGFSDVKYFYTVFRKVAGDTVNEYKKTKHI